MLIVNTEVKYENIIPSDRSDGMMIETTMGNNRFFHGSKLSTVTEKRPRQGDRYGVNYVTEGLRQSYRLFSLRTRDSS